VNILDVIGTGSIEGDDFDVVAREDVVGTQAPSMSAIVSSPRSTPFDTVEEMGRTR